MQVSKSLDHTESFAATSSCWRSELIVASIPTLSSQSGGAMRIFTEAEHQPADRYDLTRDASEMRPCQDPRAECLNCHRRAAKLEFIGANYSS